MLSFPAWYQQLLNSPVVHTALGNIWDALDADQDGYIKRSQLVHLICMASMCLCQRHHSEQRLPMFNEAEVSTIYMKAEVYTDQILICAVGNAHVNRDGQRNESNKSEDESSVCMHPSKSMTRRQFFSRW